jgi:hypothetical protein
MGCLKIHINKIETSPLKVVYRKVETEPKVVQMWYQACPQLRRIDPKAEQAGYHMSPYCAMGNNPVSYADPNGDIFFIIPQISASGKGGLSIGLEIGIGIPGVLSASITGGVNLGSKTSGYWSVQGSAGGFYAGYGSSGGFAGWGYRYAGISGGVSYGSGGWGVGLSYVGTSGSLNGSLGIGWSQSGGFDWNVSGGYTYQYSPAESKSTNSSAKGGVQSVETGPGDPVIGSRKIDIFGRVFIFDGINWIHTSFPLATGGITPTDSPIDWFIGALKTPIALAVDYGVLGFAKTGGGSGLSKILVKGTDDIINIGKFTRVKGGSLVYKKFSIHNTLGTPHGNDAIYKLYYNGSRIHTLDSTGKILRQ